MRIPLRTALVVSVLIVLAGVATWSLTRSGQTKSALPAATPVQVSRVVQRDVPRHLTAIGSVLSLHSVVIRPQVDGILNRLAVKEGQQVKIGDLLASIDDRAIRASLEQARAQLAQSQAQLQVAEVDLKRYRLLSEDNGISRQTLDQQQALVNQLKATILGHQAAVAAAQVQLSFTQIRSPLEGRVGIRVVDEGNFIRASDAQGLFSVTRIDPIGVEFSLPQDQLQTLQNLLQAPTAAKVQAFLGPDDATATVLGEGHLRLIDNQISATTGTLRAKAEFANAGQKLWPGQLVNIRIQTGLERNALVVPPIVVQRGLDQHFVYRVKGDSVESVPVELRYQDSELAIITGVNLDDVLVSDGQSRLKPGAKVEIIQAPANPAVQP